MAPTVLITGCSAGGIGSALAVAFADAGCTVYATARNVSKMAHLEGHAHISTLQLDPTSVDSVDACRKQVESGTTTLDILINNAGMSTNAPILDADMEAMKAMYDINVWGCVRVTQKFWPLVLKAKGTVVFNSSIGSTARIPFLGMYASSKVALNHIADTLRLEVAPFGVKVVTLMTGAVKSEISKKENVTGWRLPEQSLYKPIESDIAKIYLGTDLECMDVDVYAEHIAKTVLGGADGQIWKGKFATLFWILSRFMPEGVVNRITVANSGIKKLDKS